MYDAHDVRGGNAVCVVAVGALAGSPALVDDAKSTLFPGMNIGGIIFRVQDGRRQWLARSAALFVEVEWSWTFERADAYPFAGYGCAEAVAEILRRDGEGDCFAMVCKEGV
jgi:hypothetical protein